MRNFLMNNVLARCIINAINAGSFLHPRRSLGSFFTAVDYFEGPPNRDGVRQWFLVSKEGIKAQQDLGKPGSWTIIDKLPRHCKRISRASVDWVRREERR